MSMWTNFKNFAMKGNVIDLAVGFILGAAFGKIVTSLVTDVIMPPIGLILGRVDFSGLFLNLSGTSYATLSAAKAANAPVIAYGNFINTVIDFLIVSFAMFVLVQQLSRFAPAPAASVTKDCPYCLNAIPAGATRCGHCTSEMKAVAA